mgnify:CR=1 FL=1
MKIILMSENDDVSLKIFRHDNKYHFHGPYRMVFLEYDLYPNLFHLHSRSIPYRHHPRILA